MTSEEREIIIHNLAEYKPKITIIETKPELEFNILELPNIIADALFIIKRYLYEIKNLEHKIKSNYVLIKNNGLYYPKTIVINKASINLIKKCILDENELNIKIKLFKNGYKQLMRVFNKYYPDLEPIYLDNYFIKLKEDLIDKENIILKYKYSICSINEQIDFIEADLTCVLFEIHSFIRILKIRNII